MQICLILDEIPLAPPWYARKGMLLGGQGSGDEGQPHIAAKRFPLRHSRTGEDQRAGLC